VPDADRFLQRRAVLLLLGDLEQIGEQGTWSRSQAPTAAGPRQAPGGACAIPVACSSAELSA
jgi:hypothetical protein